MPRPDPKAPRAGQDSLFDLSDAVAEKRAGELRRGRISNDTDKALSAAVRLGLVRDVHLALVAVARHNAWAMDTFESENKPYGSAKVAPAQLEVLRELGLTPAAEQGGDDAFAQLIAEMNALDTSNDDTPIPHAAD